MGDDKEIHAEEQLKGRGRAVMTASNALQYAFEEDKENEIEELNKVGTYFTDAVIEGLEKEKADVNHDGIISFDELYEYVYDYVRDKTQNQTPTKSADHETNLITEAKKSRIRHIVKQSIMGADLKADVEAMRLHRRAEKVIEESGIPYTFLRPNEFMQGFINFQGSTIKNNGAFYIPAEEAKVSMVDARDIAAVAVKALVDGERHYNKTYLITGPEALSYYQAAEILSNATDKKIDYVNISDEEARGAMKSD